MYRFPRADRGTAGRTCGGSVGRRRIQRGAVAAAARAEAARDARERAAAERRWQCGLFDAWWEWQDQAENVRGTCGQMQSIISTK